LKGEQIYRELRYKHKHLILPAQMGRDGRESVLRISIMGRKMRAKLSSLFARISYYVPEAGRNCIAVAPA